MSGWRPGGKRKAETFLLQTSQLSSFEHKTHLQKPHKDGSRRTAPFFNSLVNRSPSAAKLFAKFNVPLSGYIVNRVIPAELREQKIPDYLRNRLDMQKGYLEKIDNLFGAEVLARVPEFERDIAGLPMIEKMAHAMFGDF
jgi:anion-transporting  ArsA/GET3 family ATPase